MQLPFTQVIRLFIIGLLGGIALGLMVNAAYGIEKNPDGSFTMSEQEASELVTFVETMKAAYYQLQMENELLKKRLLKLEAQKGDCA